MSKEAYGLEHPWDLHLSPLSVKGPSVTLRTLKTRRAKPSGEPFQLWSCQTLHSGLDYCVSTPGPEHEVHKTRTDQLRSPRPSDTSQTLLGPEVEWQVVHFSLNLETNLWIPSGPRSLCRALLSLGNGARSQGNMPVEHQWMLVTVLIFQPRQTEPKST